MKKLRKLLVIGVMVLSVLAMSFPFGATVKAAASTGDLIKMSGNSSVYYLGSDGKRYVFPNSTTYFSWYTDFSGVVTIPAAELQSYPLGGNVTMRPGTKLVKITTDPSVYAVEPNGTLRKIQSEAQASALYGTNWNKRVVDVPDAFFTNYTIGSALTSGTYPVGSLVKNASGADIYYYDGTNFRKIANEAALTANRFQTANVLTASTTITAGGNNITSAEFVNVAQNGGRGTVVTGSGLMVSLSATTPASATVPVKAVNVPFTVVNLTAANDGPVTVNSIVVTRTGIGAASDLNNVYLYDGSTRLTTGRTVNSSTNKVTFNNLNLTVAAGTTKALTISADTNTGTQTGNDALGIAAASDITSTGANVTGSFPVYGNSMSIANVSVGSLTVTNGSTITNPKVGESQAKVAEFKLTAGSVEDLSVKSVVLYQAGSISNSNISNFTLKQAGTTVATAAAISGNSVVFNFATPFSIDKGIVKTFEVYADINSGARSGDTIRFYIDNDSDVYAIGKTYGYGVAVTRTAYDGSAGDATDSSLSSIESGQLTLSFQGPSVTDYSVQSTGVELFRFNMTSQNNIEIRKTVVNLTAGGTVTAASGLVNTTSGNVANYTNVKLVDASNNQVLAGPKDVSTSGSDTTQDLTYTDTWTMNAGQTRTLKVVADIANFTPAADETIKATLVAFGSSDIKNLDNNTFVATGNIVPNTSMVGNTHTVKSASAALSLAGTPSAQSYINGAANVALTGINIKAGTGKDITVSSVKVTASGANSCATVGNCILSVKLYDGSTQVGQSKSLSSGTATFSGLNVAVAKGTTKTLTVKADLNNLSSVAGGTTVSVGVANPTDIVAQDSDGNSVTLTGGASTGPAMSILGAGTATVVKAGDENNVTDSRLVAAGSNDVTVAKFRFNAQNEDLQLTKLRITAVGTTAGAGAIREVSNISLWDGATKVADYITPSESVAGGTTYAVADFSNITSFIVPKDGSKDLTVKASFNTISAGARSGENLTFAIDTTNSALSTALGANYQLRGVSGSNTTVSTLTTTASGNTMYLYKTVPTVATVALPSTVLAGGEQTISKFSITADAKGTVDWTQIKFNITPSAGVTVASLRLTDESGNTVSNVTCVDGTGVCTSTTDQQVGAGSTKTYALKGTITGAVAGSTVATSIATDAAALDGTNAALTAAKNFVWSDEAASGHDIASTSDYHDGFKVKTLPTDSQALSK